MGDIIHFPSENKSAPEGQHYSNDPEQIIQDGADMQPILFQGELAIAIAWAAKEKGISADNFVLEAVQFKLEHSENVQNGFDGPYYDNRQTDTRIKYDL